MANARIVIVGPREYELVTSLYNRIFSPPQSIEYFNRRLQHRHRVLTMIAELEGRPVGFACGYELRPSTYYSWLAGVVPDARRMGIATQLMDAELAWARESDYEMARFECYNQHRPMLLLAIKGGYDVVGIRWDARTGNNLVIFEKDLTVENHPTD